MDVGSVGRDVGELQTSLIALGYEINGGELSLFTFGTTTDKAVRLYQADHRLDVDGIVGPNTLKSIKSTLLSISRSVTGDHLNIAGKELTKDVYCSLLVYAGVDIVPAGSWGTALWNAMADSDIVNDKNELASFTANVLYETGHLKTFSECFNYSDTALRLLWPNRFSFTDAKRYGRTLTQRANEQAIANMAYANRYGNGDFGSGDGWLYRGRGPMQLTFHDNYIEFFNETKNFIAVQTVSLPTNGSAAAVWFWKRNGCGALARQSKFDEVCTRINGGKNGLAERNKLTEFLLGYL